MWTGLSSRIFVHSSSMEPSNEFMECGMQDLMNPNHILSPLTCCGLVVMYLVRIASPLDHNLDVLSHFSRPKLTSRWVGFVCNVWIAFLLWSTCCFHRPIQWRYNGSALLRAYLVVALGVGIETDVFCQVVNQAGTVVSSSWMFSLLRARFSYR